MNKLSYIQLGATLFVPATHKNLSVIVSKEKYPELKSVVIDTEDGIKTSELDEALQRIKKILKVYKKTELLVFIRVRDESVLERLLRVPFIDKIEGFLLPKVSLLNVDKYLKLLQDRDFYIMPSIEGEELFNHSKLNQLRDKLLTNKEKIVLVRFGLEDMLRQLCMKRQKGRTAFDTSVTSSVIGNFIATFKSAGFGVSGGVYPYFNDELGFIEDVKRDLQEGLFTKTIIHPSQITIINELYKVTQQEYTEALEISQEEDGVFAQNGKMAEVKTMSPYAKEILLRAEVYGILPLP